MMRVLLVKLSSMGDLIQALPALSDAQAAIPNIKFDWVIDESFADVASWHPAVDRIITTAHRRWRKQKWQALKSGELRQFLKALRQTHYDLVIDAQTNFKSALIACCSKGLRCGLDKHSAREFIAHFAYQKKVAVNRQQHAIIRMRSLFAKTLGYDVPATAPDFAIEPQRLQSPSLELPAKYLVFVHNASWASKLWPERYWGELIKLAVQSGFTVLLPSGNANELARANRLANLHPQVMALPYLSLTAMAAIIARAKGVVSLDTGLGHLAAALKIPAVHLYGPTDSALNGAVGIAQKFLQADFSCSPCYQKKCSYRGPSVEQPACLAQFAPQMVWNALNSGYES